MSRSLSVEAPDLNVLCWPPEGRIKPDSKGTASTSLLFWAFLQTHGNTQPVGPRSCYCCCLTEHDLGQGLSQLSILSRIWTEFSEAPCACYKGFKLNFFCNSKSRAMLCSPHVWWDGQVAPVPALSSTGITDAEPKACSTGSGFASLQGLLVVPGRTRQLCSTHRYLNHAHLLQEELQLD